MVVPLLAMKLQCFESLSEDVTAAKGVIELAALRHDGRVESQGKIFHILFDPITDTVWAREQE